MPLNSTQPENYQKQLQEKRDRLVQIFEAYNPPALEVFESPKEHYRMRAEFKVWQQGDTASYAMYAPGEYKKPYLIDSFPVASTRINELMPTLLAEINQSEILRQRLFQAEFLTTLAGEALITLIYHKPLEDDWTEAACAVKNKLGIDIIGRSRKQKVILDKDFVTETLSVDGETFHYQQVEASFTQPNARICEDMLSWATSCASNLSGDLLELYCGNGNFTIPLSRHFDRVLATEISKTSVNSAQYNFELNKVSNTQVARMASEEFSQAMDKVRSFRRLKDIDLDSYNFSTVLVDPPRAGLDEHTIDIVKRFDNIIYVSCNPETLARDLASIQSTHKIERFALFDQFPYTHHMESGLLLSKIN